LGLATAPGYPVVYKIKESIMAKYVCPVWVGHLLASPLRKLLNNPKSMLGKHVIKDMIVLDIGCAMGFFSLPLAEMVGAQGKVICIDLQEKMLETLKKRAYKAGLLDRIETSLCRQDSLGLKGFSDKIDFVLAFAVVHEVQNADKFFSEIYEAIKSNGSLLVEEPKLHVSKNDFEITVSLAEQKGFKAINRLCTFFDRTVLLQKQNIH